MRRFLAMFMFAVMAGGLSAQVIPCNCECSGRLELQSGLGYYLLDSIVTFSRGETAGDWIPSGISVYTYDDQTRRISNRGYRVEAGAGSRTPSFRSDYLYDNSGRRTGYNQFRWDHEAWQWEENQRIRLKYDSSGNLVEQRVLVAKDGTWSEDSRAFYRYDVDGFSQVFEKEKPEPATGSWNPVFRTEYTVAEMVTTATSYHVVNNDWVPVSRNHTLKNELGVMLETASEQWDVSTGKWVERLASRFLFDASGRKTEWINRSKDPRSGKEEVSGHQLYRYDDEGKLTEIVGVTAEKSTGAVTENSKRVYYWSLHALNGLKGEIYGSLKIYPNPFKYRTRVELPGPAEKIEILSSRGSVLRLYRHVQEKELLIERGELKSGIYIIRVYGKKVSTGKLIIY